MKQKYSTDEVVAFTGITHRQLQWWDEQGIVVPDRLGRNRRYSLEDLAEIAVIQQLRHKGVSLQRMRKVIRFLQKEMGKRLYQTVQSSANLHLLTDGKRIYLETSEKQIVDILKNARQPILAVCLTDAVKQIHADMAGRKTVQRAKDLVEQRKRA